MMVRVKFAKYGPLRFTGHLDVLRFFQKAIRRAGLDVVYTHGFNPHQVMSFAAPLGVGLCSVGDYMDVEMASSDGAEYFKERMQEACPYGIDILSVKMLPEKAGNAMASVAAATYAVAFKDPERALQAVRALGTGCFPKRNSGLQRKPSAARQRSIFGPVFMTVTSTTARWYLW